MSAVCWIGCDEIGCENGLTIDSRHLKNFQGRPYVCPDHRERP